MSDRFRYRYLPRILITGGILGAVVVAILVGTYAFSNHTASSLGKASNIPAPNVGKHPKTKITAEEQQVAHKFITAAVERKDMAGSWDIVAPNSALRRGLTHAQWLTGNIPVTPFDARGGARFKIDHSWADDALLEVALFPPAGGQHQINGQVFFMMLHRFGSGAGRHWLVTYWAPRPAYGFQADQN